MELTAEQIKRYGRHLILPEIGKTGQIKLLESRILLIGTGGLGSPLAMYLAAAGVGTLGLVDFDVVDMSNLQRQIAHGTKDVGTPKITSAKSTIHDINPDVQVRTYETMFTAENAIEILQDYDMLIDGTDNFPTRYLSNDAAVMLDKPNIYGSIFRFEGQATVFAPKMGGPCYRCLYPEPPPPGMVPSCAEGGVLGVLPGMIGLIQATEAIKLITGQGTPLIGRLVLYNALDMKFREMKLRRDPRCPMCGENPTITQLIDYEQFCGIGRGAAEDAASVGIVEISGRELHAKLARGDDFLLLDVREAHEYDICRIQGSRLIPLGELPRRSAEISEWKDKEIVVHCKMGGRSRKAIQYLETAGFRNLKNLHGGIDAWSDDVDPSVPKY